MPEETKESLIHQLFGSSPKTTIMGYLTAIGTALYPLFTAEGFDIKTDWKNLVVAAAIVIWGRISKDSNGITAKEAKAVIKPEESKAAGTE